MPGRAVYAAPEPVVGADIVDYLDSWLPPGYDECLGPLLHNFLPVLADAYQFIMWLGFGLLAIAALVAGLSYGLFKDADLVKENKRWLQRILVSSLLLGSVLAFCGIMTHIKFR
jgi:hypothetical protein